MRDILLSWDKVDQLKHFNASFLAILAVEKFDLTHALCH
jgi:hypothetical protein